MKDMQVQIPSFSAAMQTGGATTGTDASAQIERLQKKLREVTEEIKATATDTTTKPKAKEQKLKLLTAQAAALQAQIAALQRQQKQAHAAKTQKAQTALVTAPQATQQSTPGSKGNWVDETA